MAKTKHRTPKSLTLWCGYSDGKPFAWRVLPANEPVLSISRTRKALAPFFADVRKVRITEVSDA